MLSITSLTCTGKAKELLRTTRKQRGGFEKQQSKGLPILSITSLSCSRMGQKELLKTSRKQRGGI
jgi:hypothetical protein